MTTMSETINVDDQEISNDAAADRDVEAAIAINVNTNTNPDSENGARSILANVSRQQSNEHTHTPSLTQSLRTIPGAHAVNNPFFEPRSSSVIADDDINNIDQTSTRSRSYTASVTRATSEMASTLPSLEETAFYNGDKNSRSHSQDNGIGLVKAVRIDNETIYTASIVEHDEDHTSSGSNRRMWRCVGIAVVLLLVTVIALSVVLTTKQRQQPLIQTDTDTTDTTATNNGKGEYNDGVLLESTPLMMDNNVNSNSWDLEQRHDSMLAIVAPISGGDDVFDIDSPDASPDRIAALQWLVEKDPARIDTDTMPQWKIRQRYVLVLLYIATIGSGWEQQYNFLSELDECKWNTVRTQQWVEDSDNWLYETFNVKGTICNEKGKVVQFKMWWNNLSGTLPHELSFFSEDIDTINFGGGSLSGTIPNSFERFTKLESLALHDNCLSGTIPEDMYRIPTLTVLLINNNMELSGSLNGFCDGGSNYKEGMQAILGDCAGSSGTIECDCCICCDKDNYECTDPQSGDSWSSLYLDGVSANGYLKSFDKPQQCISDQQEQWIQEECPCVVNIRTDLHKRPFFGQCTTDCTAKGAKLSYDY